MSTDENNIDLNINIDDSDKPSEPKVYRLVDLDDAAREELYHSLPKDIATYSDNFTIEDHMFIAATEGDVATIQIINKYFPGIAFEVLPEAVGGLTPIQYALNQGHIEAAMTLINLGADIDTQIDDGLTPLMLAAGLGQLDIVKELIKLNADTTFQDKNGRTALHYAAEANQLGVVKELLDHEPLYEESLEATPSYQDNNGFTALCIAADRGYADIVAALLEPQDFLAHDEKNVVDQTELANYINSQQPIRAIFCAYQEKQQAVIQTIEKTGITLSSEEYEKLKSVLDACYEERYEDVKKIMTEGLNIEALAKSDQKLVQSALNEPAPAATVSRVSSFMCKSASTRKSENVESKPNQTEPEKGIPKYR